MTNEQGRAIFAHYRDALGLTNRELSRVFQDKVTPDSFVDFMNGDDTALSDAQKSYIGNEAIHWVEAEDLDREQAKRMGITPPPGVREIAGIS
jgi:hypothetical protein